MRSASNQIPCCCMKPSQNASAPGVGLLNVVPATRYAAMIARLGKVVLASVIGDHENALIRNIYNNASTSRYPR